APAGASAANKRFVEAYQKRWSEYPSYAAEAAYTGLYLFKTAVERAHKQAGGGWPEDDAVIRQLEGLSIEAPSGLVTIRKEDHRAYKDVKVGFSKNLADYPFAVWDPERIMTIPVGQMTAPPGWPKPGRGHNDPSATADSVGCLWTSNVLIGEDGAILNHHRKLVPTFWEKLTWANGDGAGLRVCDTRLGRLGVLICGENTNPLARFTLMAQGEQVHVSTYPPVWPTRDPRGGGNYDLAAAIRIRAGGHAFEAKAFNIVASGFMDAAMREELATLGPEAARVLDESPRAVSMVIGPTGEP